jgi:hypothetical protein
MVSTHASEPMFQAIRAVDAVLSDRELEITCKPANLSAKELASELFTQLESIIRYKEADQPMHGIITDMHQSENVIIVAVAPGTKDRVTNVEALLKDYVRHYKKRTRPEYRGVKAIDRDDSKGIVTIRCASSKEPAYKVAKDIAEAITKTYAASASQGLGGLLLPVKVKKNRVKIRVMGPEGNWSRLEKDLITFLKSMAEGGLRCARAYSGISVKTLRRPKSSVAAKFNTVEEPPLFDTGEGHRVACYLFRPEPR